MTLIWWEMLLYGTQLYFIVTIIMVGIFGVVDTNPSLMNLDSLNLTSMYDGIWLPVFDGNSYKNNATWTLDDHIGVVDIDTSQTHLSSASHVLSICVLALSSLGLASTFLLLFALVKVIFIHIFIFAWQLQFFDWKRSNSRCPSNEFKITRQIID